MKQDFLLLCFVFFASSKDFRQVDLFGPTDCKPTDPLAGVGSTPSSNVMLDGYCRLSNVLPLRTHGYPPPPHHTHTHTPSLSLSLFRARSTRSTRLYAVRTLLGTFNTLLHAAHTLSRACSTRFCTLPTHCLGHVQHATRICTLHTLASARSTRSPRLHAAQFPSIAFRHLPPNSTGFGYATEGALFVSAQLSTDAVSALRNDTLCFI